MSSNRGKKFFLPVLGVGLAMAVSLAGAQAVSAPATGSVTGHVTCSDTQRTAKFAHVILFGVPGQLTTVPKADPDADMATQMAAMTQALKSLKDVNMVQAQTGTDGAFDVSDVAPGDYYLFATATGYVAPLGQIQALMAGGADLKKPLPGVPVVHVTAEHTTNADVTMERGAAISGTLLWDDGSPLSGAIMTAVPAQGEQKPPQQFSMLAMANILGGLSITDDLGHYRIAGLVPGDYFVKATIQSGQQTALGGSMNLSRMIANTPLVVFAPSAFHQADAKAVTVHAGEDLRDQAMTLNLGGLHSVSGKVSSAEDHHGINSATVRMQSETDKEFVRSAAVDAAGNFTVTYLPPGTYSLRVAGAEDTKPAKKEGNAKPKLFTQDETVRSYMPGKMSVIVGDSDVTGQNLELAVDKNPAKEPDFNQLLGGDDETPAKPH